MFTTFNKVINNLIKKKETKLILIIKSTSTDPFVKQKLQILKLENILLVNTRERIEKMKYA
ncbi:hypothetical protein, partial [Paenibacillus amylolyticus]|uniref:hypothetical protein n=1 Tax=Paenibacillus amylolyticus TaxID=1451 RepID=UPI00339621D4